MINLIEKLFRKIGYSINLMEVCGTHTEAIFKHGIRSLLPEGLKLISGPGCPVCVTSMKDIDKVVTLSMFENVMLCTFGDMMRVKGGQKSLLEAKAEGADVRIVYSPLDCLKVASENKDKMVVFLSVGFETTAPLVAATIFEAERLEIKNFYIYSVHKLVPPVLELLLQSKDIKIDGFMLPGHVSAVIGRMAFDFISEKYLKPCVITGFSADDILAGISMLLKQIKEGRAVVEIQYKSAVNEIGNQKAISFMYEYFEPVDSFWRGIGLLKKSGLKLRNKWSHRDIEKIFDINISDYPEPEGCQCGLVLKGIKVPLECPLFEKVCTPESPVGACMVSSEGSCATYYKYKDISIQSK